MICKMEDENKCAFCGNDLFEHCIADGEDNRVKVDDSMESNTKVWVNKFLCSSCMKKLNKLQKI